MSAHLPISVAVLTWRSPLTLARTLRSYREGLSPVVAQRLVWSQGNDEEEARIARAEGYEVLGTSENVGIGPAYRALLDATAAEHVLFLECDWRLSGPEPGPVLADALDLLDRGRADVVRLRSRRRPGSPLWFLEYQNRELDHPASVLDSVYWEPHPERVFPGLIESVDLRHRWYLAGARHAGWTNNPHLARREWLLEHIAPFCEGDGIALEHDIESWWAEQAFTVAQGPGLFAHDRRDGPGHRPVGRVQDLRNQARVGTRIRRFRRPPTPVDTPDRDVGTGATHASDVPPMGADDRTISLLHATYHRPGGPSEVRDAWLAAADRPDLVEYVVALDDDDAVALEQTAHDRRVVGPARPGHVTAVRNWNAAAGAATGDLLMVIADDLFPPQGWDTALLGVVGRLNPARVDFAVKVSDIPWDDDVLMRHPVVSRAFYERFGLFSPAYEGVFCDLDLTTLAFWRSAILDGRSIHLDHRHPSLSQGLARSRSQSRISAEEQNQRGRATYERRWTGRQRSVEFRLVPAGDGHPPDGTGLWRDARRNRLRSDLAFERHLAGRALWLATHPADLLHRLRGRRQG